MTTAINYWLTYQKRWDFKGSAEEAVIFSGANGGYESRMQYDFMLSQGLRPDHYFLDYGCGALRGTIRLVDYLLNGHFCGSDISVGLMKEALIECGRLNKKHTPLLQLMESFDLIGLFDMQFDFILCNSVTVHIEPEDIVGLIHSIHQALSPTGKCYVSIHPLAEDDAEFHRWDGYRHWYKPSFISQAASIDGFHLESMPGKIFNRIPGQRKPVIPIVNTNMTEWMMEGSL